MKAIKVTLQASGSGRHAPLDDTRARVCAPPEYGDIGGRKGGSHAAATLTFIMALVIVNSPRDENTSLPLTDLRVREKSATAPPSVRGQVCPRVHAPPLLLLFFFLW